MEFFTRFKNAFVLTAVLLAQTVALAIQVRRVPEPGRPDAPQVRLLRLWAASVVTPVGRAAHVLGGGVRGGWTNYVALWHVRQQNQALQAQLAAIRLQQTAEAEDVIQGRRLQALLEFREHYVTSTVAAQVIGTSGSDQTHLLLLDKGADEGLKPDMPVITPDGIVGKLRDVFPHSAQMLLINDPTAGAGVILESTRIRAILKGTTTGKVQIGNLTADSRIQPGERVLTSGGDQVFPRGLPVGVVESIAPDPEHQPYTAITVRPAAKLSQLEEVLVITGTQAELPAAAQQDLADAAARHAAEIVPGAKAPRGLDLSGDAPKEDAGGGSAAPVVAEGAPGAVPGSAPGSALGSAPGSAPGGVVPRPLPTLHPDRYSPGSTPAAAELTPGAPPVARPAAPEAAPAASPSGQEPR